MMNQTEVETILERRLAGQRLSFTAMLRGKSYEIFMGMDGQLWRVITDRELRLGVAPTGCNDIGQYTVASGPVDTFAFCKNFGLPGWDRDRMLEMLAWKYSGHGFWDQLAAEYKQYGKYL